ncbi:MAG: hypothetical protein ACK53L_30775, partial [Pirellulaceae bacterium]
MNYDEFVSSKRAAISTSGITGDITLPAGLFHHQRDIVQWALRRGRAAIFADTGLGKTAMQTAWADEIRRHTNGRV